MEALRNRIQTWLSAHRTLVIIAAASASLVGLCAGAAFGYDHSQREQIADGVRIGGVPVGGMSADEARGVVERRVVAPLRKPVEVEFEGRRYELSSKRLQQTANVDSMIEEALDASRAGGFVSRVVRYVKGGDLSTEIPADVSYRKPAVKRFVRDLGEAIDRDPVNATLLPAGDELSPTPGKPGIRMRPAPTQERIEAAIVHPADGRVAVPVVARTKPEITKSELADEYPLYITVDRGAFTLRLFEDLKLTKSYTVAVGQIGLETPAGLYSIQDKQVDPSWHVPNSAWAGDLAGQTIPPGPGNPLLARWMGIYNGAGIHGTSDTGSLGSAASHGCVRMSVPDVIDLYDRVEVGTPIYIL